MQDPALPQSRLTRLLHVPSASLYGLVALHILLVLEHMPDRSAPSNTTSSNASAVFWGFEELQRSRDHNSTLSKKDGVEEETMAVLTRHEMPNGKGIGFPGPMMHRTPSQRRQVKRSFLFTDRKTRTLYG